MLVVVPVRAIVQVLVMVSAWAVALVLSVGNNLVYNK